MKNIVKRILIEFWSGGQFFLMKNPNLNNVQTLINTKAEKFVTSESYYFVMIKVQRSKTSYDVALDTQIDERNDMSDNRKLHSHERRSSFSSHTTVIYYL